MLIDLLRKALGDNALLSNPDDMEAFLGDWRGRYRGDALCVALPSDTAQVAAVVELCARHSVPVLAQGGNTSLCGGSVPNPDAPLPVVVSLQRMRSIRSIDVTNDTISVDAGCVLATVQQAAIDNNRLYPVSLGAEGSCQIGGAIATNAGGTGVLRYGNMRENVLGLEVVLPDGRVWDGMYALRKNNTGYDLRHLFIGSEGTLGIITGAVLKLHPLPGASAVAWLGLDSPQAGIEILQMFRDRCGARISGFELMNRNQVALVVEKVPDRRNPLDDEFEWHVLVELSDTAGAGELDAAMSATLEAAYGEGLIRDAVIASSDAQRETLWQFRHSVSEANKKGGIGLTTDCAVPISAVPEFIDAATEAVRAIEPGLPMVIVSHLGDGNVHLIPFFSFDRWAGVEHQEAYANRIKGAVNDAAVRLGGTFSAEHGIGGTLVEEMRRYKSPVELSLMQTIKRGLDPKGLFNPGRLLPAPDE